MFGRRLYRKPNRPSDNEQPRVADQFRIQAAVRQHHLDQARTRIDLDPSNVRADSKSQIRAVIRYARTLRDFLQVRPAYLPPISLLLRRLHVPLLAVRDVVEEACDFYEDAYSVQGDKTTQRRFRSAYLNAMNAMSAKKLHAPDTLEHIVRNVADHAGVALAIAKHAVRSTAVVQEVWGDNQLQRYKLEMPIEAAVEWFVKNRSCSWNGANKRTR